MSQESKKLKLLVAKNKLKEVFDILKDKIENNDHLNHLVMETARYYEIEKAINMNTVKRDDANIQMAQIRKSVLSLIDEMEADEKEEQKYLPDAEEQKRGVNVIYKETSTANKNIGTNQKDWQMEGLVLRFLTVFDRWYFSPLRIKKWGSQQMGFQELDNYSSRKIKNILERLLAEGKVKKTLSKKGNPIYKVN